MRELRGRDAGEPTTVDMSTWQLGEGLGAWLSNIVTSACCIAGSGDDVLLTTLDGVWIQKWGSCRCRCRGADCRVVEQGHGCEDERGGMHDC